MARTALPMTTTPANTGSAPTATAIDPTNGHVITLSTTPLEDVLIVVNNTTVSTKVVTIKAGANPPALEAGQGDLAVTCAASTNCIPIGPLSSGRFVQADGTVNIDIAASMTGTIVVYKVGRTA